MRRLTLRLNLVNVCILQSVDISHCIQKRLGMFLSLFLLFLLAILGRHAHNYCSGAVVLVVSLYPADIARLRSGLCSRGLVLSAL